MKQRLAYLTAIVVLLVLFVPTAVGQVTTASISGQIKDGHGTLEGVTIVAEHLPTHTKYGTTTRKDGRYNIPDMKVGGPYLITVTMMGMKTEIRSEVTLSLGENLEYDFTLQEEQIQLGDAVVTSSRNYVVNSNRTGASEVVGRSQIENMPSINRSLTDVAKLTPYVTSGTDGGISMGGRSNLSNNIMVDGASFNNAFGLSSTLGGGTGSEPISLEAIEQVQVAIAPFDARQGNFTGGSINSVTKSGTNEVKASVYSYIRTDGMQGKWIHGVEQTKDDYSNYQYGFSIGAPIIKNKLFAFVNFEQDKVISPGTSWKASRNGNSGAGISNAKAEDLDPLKAFLISKYNYNPGDYEGYDYKTDATRITARLDWNMTSNHNLSVKFFGMESQQDKAPTSSRTYSNFSSRQPNEDMLSYSGIGYLQKNNYYAIIGELSSRFGNKYSNNLQIGFTAQRDDRESKSGKDFPTVEIENGAGRAYTAFGYETASYNNLMHANTFQLNDNFTIYSGKHEILLGTQNAYKTTKNGYADYYAGAYTYSSLANFYDDANNQTSKARNYVLRYSALPDGSFPFAELTMLDLSFYAQDKWTVLPNLKLTYGLRVELSFFMQDLDRNVPLENIEFQNGMHIDVSKLPSTKPSLLPRVGFNWDVFSDKRTQVRGGAGLFSGAPQYVWVSNQASNNGLLWGISNQANPTNRPFSPDINKYRPAQGAANTSYQVAITDPDLKNPKLFRADLGIDQKLGDGFIITLEGSYSKDINAIFHKNIELPDNSTTINLAGDDNRMRFPNKQRNPVTAANQTLANPNIEDAIYLTNSSKGYSYFVTLQLQKDFGKEFSLNTAYTYTNGKTVTAPWGSVAKSAWTGRAIVGDPNGDELGYLYESRPHRFMLSATYKKEYAKHFATTIGLSAELRSGARYSYIYNGDLNNDGVSNDLMFIPKTKDQIRLVPVNAADTRTPDQMWAQLDAFISQDPYLSKHRGEYAERNGAVNAGEYNIDLHFAQDFFIKVGSKQKKNILRFECNIFNLPNLLSKDWGIKKTYYSSNFLQYKTPLAADNIPSFAFSYRDAANQVPYTNTFYEQTNIYSRWRIQLGFKYIFN